MDEEEAVCVPVSAKPPEKEVQHASKPALASLEDGDDEQEDGR